MSTDELVLPEAVGFSKGLINEENLILHIRNADTLVDTSECIGETLTYLLLQLPACDVARLQAHGLASAVRTRYRAEVTREPPPASDNIEGILDRLRMSRLQNIPDEIEKRPAWSLTQNFPNLFAEELFP